MNALVTLDAVFAANHEASDDVLELAVHSALGGGLWLEFGVFRGASIRRIGNAAPPDAHIYGFDSFEGLPEDWRPGFERGRFKCEPPTHEIPENVSFVVGDIRETLPRFLIDHPKHISFMHIDVDVYSTTKAIFDFCTPLIRKGTVILLDDVWDDPKSWPAANWVPGCNARNVGRAFREFLGETGTEIAFIGRRRGEAFAFRVVA